MKLSDRYAYHVLCEDIQMRRFIEAFLLDHGIPYGKIRTSNIPAGKGSGEAFVRREYSREINILKRTNYNRTVLIICSDADNVSVNERRNALDETATKEFKKWDRTQEPIMIWIPKRTIETWIRHLSGENVDENMTFPHTGKPVSCKREAEAFSKFCQDIEIINVENVPSLYSAKEEYIRVCKMQG